MQRNDTILLGLLYLVSFIGQASIIILNLGLIFFAKNTLMLDPAYVGILAAAGPVTYCFGLIFLKRFSAALKPIHASLIASAGLAVIPALIVITSDIRSAFILYGIYGLFMSLFWPPIMGWISRGREQKELGRRMGQFNVAWSVGILFGPFLAGILSELRPAYAVFSAGMFALGVSLLMLLASHLLPDIRQVPSRKSLNAVSAETDGSTPLRYLTWAGLFTGYFVFGITMNIFPMYAQDYLMYPEGRIGMLLLFRGLAATGCFFLLAKTHYWHHNHAAIFGFQVLTILTCLFGITASGFVSLSIFMLLFGVCFAHLYTFAIFHGASGSIDREHRMALHETILTLGVFFGSALGGMLYARIAYTLTMTAATAIGTAGLLIQLVLYVSKVRGKGHTS